MRMIAVYRFEYFDHGMDRPAIAPSHATAAAIRSLGGHPLPETARFVDADEVAGTGILPPCDSATGTKPRSA